MTFNFLKGLKENYVADQDLPISPETAEWKVLEGPERLSRTFEFQDFKKLYYFVRNLLFHQDEMHHHSTVTINHQSVLVETFTHGVNSVTELDKELASFCDELFEDVQYYYTVEKEGKGI